MIAIIGGLGAAVAWAIAVLSSAHASRLIGSRSTVAAATFLGTLLALPFVVASGPPPAMSATTAAWLVGSGFASLTGLLLVYRALGMGKIGIVAAVASTEGAVAAVISILLGERLTVTILATLVVVAVGIVVVALASEEGADPSTSRRHVDPAVAGRAIALGSAAALSFGIGLYGTAQVGNALPLAYSVLPTRVVGTLVLFLPMLLTGRLRITRQALPAVVTVAIVEVAGTALYAFGARQSVAIAAVLSSQFAALAAIAAFVLYREHLTLRQRSGVIAIAAGIALLAGLRA